MGNIPAQHDLRSLLNIHKEEIFTSLNSHHVGTVAEVNITDQTLKGTVAYRKSDGLYPVLLECPFFVLGGGSGSLRFPIAVGDSCLFLFNDRDIDNWFSGGNEALPNTARKHSFADAFALVGLRNLQQSLTDYDADRTELVHGTTKMSLSAKIRLINSTTDLKTVLDDLVTAINGMEVVVAGGSSAGTYPCSDVTSNHGDLLES